MSAASCTLLCPGAMARILTMQRLLYNAGFTPVRRWLSAKAYQCEVARLPYHSHDRPSTTLQLHMHQCDSSHLVLAAAFTAGAQSTAL